MSADATDILVDKIRQGDQRACSDLYEALYPRIYAIARRYQLNGYSNDDLIQIAFIGIFRAIPDYRYCGVPFYQFACIVARRRIGEVWKVIKRLHIPQRLVESQSTLYDPFRIVCAKDELEFVLDKMRQWCREQNVIRPAVVMPLKRDDIYARPVCTADGRRYESVYEASKDRTGLKAGANISKLAIVNSIRYGHVCGGTKWAWAEVPLVQKVAV